MENNAVIIKKFEPPASLDEKFSKGYMILKSELNGAIAALHCLQQTPESDEFIRVPASESFGSDESGIEALQNRIDTLMAKLVLIEEAQKVMTSSPELAQALTVISKALYVAPKD